MMHAGVRRLYKRALRMKAPLGQAKARRTQALAGLNGLVFGKAGKPPHMAAAMTHAGYLPRRRPRLSVVAAVFALHLIAAALLIRAFAPDFARDLVRPATEAFNVSVMVPTPQPSPEPPPKAASAEREGAAAPAGKRARPREVAAPKPAIVLSAAQAPVVPAKGLEDSAGARESGEGAGAGGAGQGTGAGAEGTGTGTGGSRVKAVKIAGDIVSARDYPKATRALRLGSSVTVALTVSPEGRVSDCRILRPSRDPEADRITCRLASQRFRFRPAHDADGTSISSVYGWQQRWFTPERD
jgi:protein TonB